MQWIKCSDRMPELHKEVLITIEELIEIARLEDENHYKRSVARKKELYPVVLRWYTDNGDWEYEDPSHWMPLPELPKYDTP